MSESMSLLELLHTIGNQIRSQDLLCKLLRRSTKTAFLELRVVIQTDEVTSQKIRLFVIRVINQSF